MELGRKWMEWFGVVVLVAFIAADPILPPLQVTRQNSGDIFRAGNSTSCDEESCVGFSSGTAVAASSKDLCTCQCHSHLPAFREDLRICVDDIHECVLAPFVGGATSQQIPFVFLPLKGQIIHPSKEISFAGVQTPVCAVSGAKFLTENGWMDLRNPLDTDVPFRLFRDEGRTFLQWVGESDLRTRMSGRLVMVYLMCRELSPQDESAPTIQTLFSPCVAFRIVGTPSRYLNNVSEVAFFPDAHASGDETSSDSLSVTEYVAIGICSVLLGLIYVASVFLYLHLRKRNSSKSKGKDQDNHSVSDAEEGIVKSNPLLSMVAHFSPPENAYSDSTNSDNETAPDIIQHHDDRKKHMQMQITSAMIHPQQRHESFFSLSSQMDYNHQESSSIERLPEENVSIVETLEGREDRPDNLKALTGTVRKKLYFNPAYFEPQLLLAPPPAALEFLCKIREVITLAKQKMEAKKFTPSLLNIPEEDNNYAVDPSDFAKVSRKGSVISLKRENSRRKSCSGCPGCEPQDFKSLCGKLPEFPSLAACGNCTSGTESKQRSIRKWLEDVPVLKHDDDDYNKGNCLKRVRSPVKALPSSFGSERAISPKAASERPMSPKTPSERAISPRPASERAMSPESTTSETVKKKRSPSSSSSKKVVKPKTPPPPKPETKENKNAMNFPPPDMIHEAMAMDNRDEVKIPTLTKKQMNAVINELTVHRNLLVNEEKNEIIDYETDSLERHNKGYCTPTDYADISSSQPSPSLSTALPENEEMTMRNAIFNKKTGNMTISKINMDSLQEDDHDYELIVMKKGSMIDANLYKLPELLQRNNGYSLVSEVYVNNGYNYGSNPSSPSESNCSTMERKSLKVRYQEGIEKPGKLLIEVEDCPDNYIPVDESDSFEPDTLDRKPSKLKVSKNDYDDSLERPNQILLKTTGSFRKDVEAPKVQENSNFNRVFGSLREIYEAKTKGLALKPVVSNEVKNMDDEEGRLLTLQDRHLKRQRKLGSTGNSVQPDVIPPPPHDAPIYEHPKPPRKVLLDDYMKPPLPPKNGYGRSASQASINALAEAQKVDTPGNDYELCLVQKSKKDGNILTSLIQAEDMIVKKAENDQIILHNTVNSKTYRLPVRSFESLMDGKPVKKKSWKSIAKEDSGYLSTDSNESKKSKFIVASVGSETDESTGDAHSESGAESVETHSVFFGSFRKQNPAYMYGSVDSGVIGEEGHSSTDSENMSYTTVVPVTN